MVLPARLADKPIAGGGVDAEGGDGEVERVVLAGGEGGGDGVRYREIVVTGMALTALGALAVAAHDDVRIALAVQENGTGALGKGSKAGF